MKQLTDEMKQIISHYNCGAVATVNKDGSPSVSPKATFVIVSDDCIAYGNIRSPGTRANLLERPAVEINFIDVLARMAVRVRGQAEIVDVASESAAMLKPYFENSWADYLPLMQDFVRIDIENVELVFSPAYDAGFSRDQLIKTNFEKLSGIAD